MKTQSITVAADQYDPVIESIIHEADAELEHLAVKRGKHFAKTNQPNLTGDKLEHYTGEFRAHCEKLCARISHHLQPAKQLPQGKIDIDFAEEKVDTIQKEIETLRHQNHNDQFELGDFNPKSFRSILFWGGLITAIILIGEILFNAKAFLVTGENLLFALAISISISVTVAIASHLASFLYKSAKNVFQRRVIVILSLSIATIVFIALSMLRSAYLASHDVHVSPFYFVIFNLFFFIVSAVLSFFLLPTWEEIKQNMHHLRIYNAIQKRNKLIRDLQKEKEEIKAVLLEKTKYRLRIIYYAKYGGEVIRKIYFHAVEVFKSTNLAFRSDRKTPDCFSDTLAEPDMENIALLLTPKKQTAMKINITVIGILSIGVLAGIYFHKTPMTTEINVLRDITDKHLAQPNANEILKLIDLTGENKWNGAIFRFTDLSDVSYNRIAETKISPVNKWLSNEIERAKEIKRFQNEVSQILADSANDSVGKEYSSVFFPIAKGLKHLTESKSQRKILLLYSDLMQNDFEVSLYSKKEFQLLQSNPDTLKIFFQQQEPLPSLTGLEIYLLYQPLNAEDDKRFRVVSDFYKKLFEEKGAIVHIQANLSN